MSSLSIPYFFRQPGKIYYVPRAHRYEAAKQRWDAEHPEATPSERDRALRQICRRLKF